MLCSFHLCVMSLSQPSGAVGRGTSAEEEDSNHLEAIDTSLILLANNTTELLDYLNLMLDEMVLLDSVMSCVVLC